MKKGAMFYLPLKFTGECGTCNRQSFETQDDVSLCIRDTSVLTTKENIKEESKFQKGEEVYIYAKVVDPTPDGDGDIGVGLAFGGELIRNLTAHGMVVRVAQDTVFHKEDIK